MGWGIIIALFFGIDLLSTVKNKETWRRDFASVLIRTLIIIVISICALLLAYAIEISQISEWTGLTKLEVIKVYFARQGTMATNSLYIKGQTIHSLKDWIIHILKGMFFNLKSPVSLSLPFVPSIVITVQFFYFLGCFILFQAFLAFKLNFNSLYQKYFHNCIIVSACYIVYFLALHILSPRLASHDHVIMPIFYFFNLLYCQ